jgi:hypothetical protein
MKKALTSIIIGSLILASCAGREARHFAVTNPSDSSMDCAGISREWNANEDLIASIAKDQGSKTGKNVAAAVVGGLIFLPALFFMDLKGAEKAELIALRARARVLTELNAQKRCKPLQSKLGEFYNDWDKSQSE